MHGTNRHYMHCISKWPKQAIKRKIVWPNGSKFGILGFYLFIDRMFMGFTCEQVIFSLFSLLSTIIRSTSKVIRWCETLPFIRFSFESPSRTDRMLDSSIRMVNPINWHTLWAQTKHRNGFHQSRKETAFHLTQLTPTHWNNKHRKPHFYQISNHTPRGPWFFVWIINWLHIKRMFAIFTTRRFEYHSFGCVFVNFSSRCH